MSSSSHASNTLRRLVPNTVYNELLHDVSELVARPLWDNELGDYISALNKKAPADLTEVERDFLAALQPGGRLFETNIITDGILNQALAAFMQGASEKDTEKNIDKVADMITQRANDLFREYTASMPEAAKNLQTELFSRGDQNVKSFVSWVREAVVKEKEAVKEWGNRK